MSDATMQPLTIVLLAAAVAGGVVLGWLLRGERRDRENAVRIARQQTQLDSQRATLDRLRRQRETLRSKAHDAGHRQREADRRVAEMREALDEQLAQRRKLEKRLRELGDRIATEKDERKRLSRQLRLMIQRTQEARAAREDAPEPTDAAPDADDGSSADQDDLTRVRGIGPAMARELAAHGIRTLGELAALEPPRLDALDRELRFPGRIRRDRWVEQARELVAGREP